jgi:hypothetical protein
VQRPGGRSVAALTSTTLGPSLHGDSIALGRHRTTATHAHIGHRVALMLGDGTRTLDPPTVAVAHNRVGDISHP